MKRKLIKQNKLRLSKLFKEGRRIFPRGLYTNVTFLGNFRGQNLFGATEVVVKSGIIFDREARWRDD